MPRALTTIESETLAHIVPSADAWWTAACTKFGDAAAEPHLAAKVARWRPAYEAAVAAEGANYKNRVQRDAFVPTPSVAALQATVKLESRRRILGVYPDWMQQNMTARGVELTKILVLNDAWTAAEQAAADVLQAAWDWVKSVRAASDEIEAHIATLTEAERRTFNVAAPPAGAPQWPANP